MVSILFFLQASTPRTSRKVVDTKLGDDGKENNFNDDEEEEEESDM